MYADNQFALWNASSYETAAAKFDASVNITAADLQGVNSFTVADTIIGGEPASAACWRPTSRCCSLVKHTMPAGLFAAGRPCSPPGAFAQNSSAALVALRASAAAAAAHSPTWLTSPSPGRYVLSDCYYIGVLRDLHASLECCLTAAHRSAL